MLLPRIAESPPYVVAGRIYVWDIWATAPCTATTPWLTGRCGTYGCTPADQ